MPEADPRRQLLLSLLRAGLAAVDGRACVVRALRAAPPPRGQPLWVAAIGKAACGMAFGAHEALPGRIGRTLIITKDGHAGGAAALPDCEVIESSHPLPDARALAAGTRLLRFVDALPAGVLPLFLVSGGASALVEVLQPGFTLDDLRALNAAGLASGEDIGALNRRRGTLSLLKGGRLAQRLAGRPARALFVSDVPGDDPAVIGSGLMARAADGPDAVERTVVARIEDAMQAAAAAAAAGLVVHVAAGRFDAEAGELGPRLAQELIAGPAQLRVWGGESVVKLPADPGLGGRNQHLALAAAQRLAGHDDLLLLAVGTDGTDGPTPDAGALVDGGTWERVAMAALDAAACLRRADSHTALAAAGDLLHTGPTGTNVGDLVLGLRLSREQALAWWSQQGTRPHGRPPQAR